MLPILLKHGEKRLEGKKKEGKKLKKIEGEKIRR